MVQAKQGLTRTRPSGTVVIVGTLPLILALVIVLRSRLVMLAGLGVVLALVLFGLGVVKLACGP
jgi:hypothetical protein